MGMYTENCGHCGKLIKNPLKVVYWLEVKGDKRNIPFCRPECSNKYHLMKYLKKKIKCTEKQ